MAATCKLLGLLKCLQKGYKMLKADVAFIYLHSNACCLHSNALVALNLRFTGVCSKSILYFKIYEYLWKCPYLKTMNTSPSTDVQQHRRHNMIHSQQSGYLVYQVYHSFKCSVKLKLDYTCYLFKWCFKQSPF